MCFYSTYLKRLERDIKIAWVGGNIFHVMTLPPGFLNMIGKNGGTEDAIQTIFQKNKLNLKNIFLYYFIMLVLKIKKYYFDIFLNKKIFKN